jgi:hypothetical protein
MTTNRKIVYITIGAVLLSVASAGVVYYIGKKKNEKVWDNIELSPIDFNTDGLPKEPPPPDIIPSNYIDDNSYPEWDEYLAYLNEEDAYYEEDSYPIIGAGLGVGTGGELAPPDFLTTIINFFSKSKGFEGQSEVLSKVSNKGFVDKTFQQMLSSVGWYSGAAWCAYFVKAFFTQFYSFDKDFINKNFGALAVGNFNNIKKLNNSKWVADGTNNPQAGDIVVWRKGNTSLGHTGIILEVDDNSVTTLEGNYGIGNQREGDKVAKIKYSKSSFKIGSGGELKILGFIRRVFTEDEKKNIYYDEAQQTLKFK